MNETTPAFELIANRISEREDELTSSLISEFELNLCKTKGYFNRKQLIVMCYWKYPGNMHNVRENSGPRADEVSRKMFDLGNNHRSKVLCLTTGIEGIPRLSGVRVPTASAILTLTDPDNYGVIDYRVWNLLVTYGEPSFNSLRDRGYDFSIDDYVNYLELLKQWRERLNGRRNINVRAVERTLYREALLVAYRNLDPCSPPSSSPTAAR